MEEDSEEEEEEAGRGEELLHPSDNTWTPSDRHTDTHTHKYRLICLYVNIYYTHLNANVYVNINTVFKNVFVYCSQDVYNCLFTVHIIYMHVNTVNM